MNATLLAISIGNTHTRLGAFEEGKLVARERVPNNDPAALRPALEKLFAPLREHGDAPVVLASVNPPLTERVAREVQQALGVKPRRVERDMPIPIGRQLDRESIIGEDRLLNAAAAYDTIKQSCVVVDAGTAMTVDFIDGSGTFHGGAILPGARLMLR